MKRRRPVLITYIVDLNILNCLLLLVLLFPDLTKRIGIISNPAVPSMGAIVRNIVMIIVLILSSYGLLTLKKWGYWLMLAYNMFFLIVSMLLLLGIIKQSLLFQDLIPSIIGVYLILSAKRYFVKEKHT